MNKNNWTKFADKLPQDEDFDQNGNIIVLFDDGSYDIFDKETDMNDSMVAWATLPKPLEVTRDDADLKVFNKFIETYSLGSSMVNSLNLKLAYELGLKEARRQAREGLDKVFLSTSEKEEEAVQALLKTVA
jgi:hypothetical protein